MPTKLYFTWIGSKKSPWEGEQFAKEIGRLLLSSERFSVCDNPDDADLIALVESNTFKERSYIKELFQHPLITGREEDCFTINYEDDALGILPGLYAGLPKCRFENFRHISTSYLKPPNDLDAKREAWLRDNSTIRPKHELSFRGAMSHPVREKILKFKDSFGRLGPITHINRWFDHTEDEILEYWKEIQESKFVLCPRGISPTSIRLFEVLEAGRVPVIISDQWVPISDLCWDEFAVIVKEDDLESIPMRIISLSPKWESMAAQARQCWEENFSPKVSLEIALLKYLQLRDNKSSDLRPLMPLKQYRGLSRRWQLGWTLPQRITRRIKNLYL